MTGRVSPVASERRFGHFDADAHQAAQEPPILEIGGFLYRGRLLSIEEWLPFAEQLDRLTARQRAGEAVPKAAFIAVYRAYLRAAFPRRRFRFWAPDPVAELFRLPWGTVTEALARFFDLQARATNPPSQTGPTPAATNGTDSPRSTPAGAADATAAASSSRPPS